MANKGALTQSKEIRLMLEAGCVYRYAGRFAEARKIFHGIRALLPTQEVADLSLAGVCLDEKKLDEAEAHCRRALQVNRASAAAYAQLAEIQLLQRDIVGARRNLKRAAEIASDGPIASHVKVLLTIASKLEAKR